MKTPMNKLPDETLFRLGGYLFVAYKNKAYHVVETGPMSYAASGTLAPITDLAVDVAGRLPGFRPSQEPEKGKKGKGKGKKSKTTSTVSGVNGSCSCAKPAPAVDGAVEDVNALARHVRTLNNKLAALRREMEEGPKPRKSRKAAPAPSSYDEDMPF